MASAKTRSRAPSGPGQSRLLSLLRKHGFAEDLPPSTASWLEARPVFRWLADHLGDGNFVAPELQELHDSIQLQEREDAADGGGGGGGSASGGGGGGGDASGGARRALMSAMGIDSDTEGSDSDGGGGGGGADGNGDDERNGSSSSAGLGFAGDVDSLDDVLGALSGVPAGDPRRLDALQRAIEEQEAHKQLLQRQLALVAATSRRVAAAAAAPRGAARQQRAALGGLRAAQLRAAQAAAAEAGARLDAELGALADELSGWARLAEAGGGAGASAVGQPGGAAAAAAVGAPRGDWLLCTADAAAYAARDAEMRRLVDRGVALVSAAAGVAPPPGAEDDGGGGGGGGDAGGDAERWRDQERRNEGLREELARQRAAFKVAHAAHAAAVARRAGAEGALAAVEALVAAERRRRRQQEQRVARPMMMAAAAGAALPQHQQQAAAAAGGVAEDGVDAVLASGPQLRREAEALERERAELEDGALPAVHTALAALNDTHVLEVCACV